MAHQICTKMPRRAVRLPAITSLRPFSESPFVTLVTELAELHTTVTNRGPFHMRTFFSQQRWTLLKFYFVASYLVLIEELIRAAMH